MPSAASPCQGPEARCSAGESGLGRYHGRSSFETFSHRRSALLRGAGREALNAPRYPPYAPRRLPLLRAATETKRRAACALL